MGVGLQGQGSSSSSSPNAPLSLSPLTGVLANLFGTGAQVAGGGISLAGNRGFGRGPGPGTFSFAEPAFGRRAFTDIVGLTEGLELGPVFEQARAIGQLGGDRGISALEFLDESVLPASRELAETGLRTDVGPIARQARRAFERETIPRISEQFAPLTGAFSTDFLGQVTEAGADVESELGALQVGLDEAAAGRRAGGIPVAAQVAAASAGLPVSLGSDFLTFEQQRQQFEQAASPAGAQLALLQALAGITPTGGIPQSPSQKSKSGGGGLQILSSRTLKEANRPLDDAETLELVGNLPVERWRYIGDDTEHIGPYAEDFHAAFGVGGDATIHIVDAFGVTLAAVKALSREVRELRKELAK